MRVEMETKVKELYEELKEEQQIKKEAEEKWHDLWEERTMLEQTPTIQNYLRILKEMKEVGKVANGHVQTDEEFYDTLTTDYFCGENNTNHIYVYMGTFAFSNEIDRVHGTRKIRIPRDSFKKKGWNEYMEIERHYMEALETIPGKEAEEFESNNIVLFAPIGSDEKVFYQTVSRLFFQYVIEFGQEEAVQKIMEQFGTKEQMIKRERNKKL